MIRVCFIPLFIITGLYQLYKGEINLGQYFDMIFLDILVSIAVTLAINLLILKIMG